MKEVLISDGEGNIVGISRFEHPGDLASDNLSSQEYVLDSPLPDADEVILESYKVIDGSIIAVGSRPSPAHFWRKATKAWELDISVARSRSCEALKVARNATEFGPFTYNGMTFDGDVDAQRRLAGLVSAAKSAIAAGHSFAKDFTLADNSVVQLTAEDFIGIEMVKIWQVDAAFQEYRTKKAAIEVATTLEELEAI